MPNSALIILFFLGAVGLACLRQVALDRKNQGVTGTAGAIMIWTVYLGYTGFSVAVSALGVWPIDMPFWLACTTGVAALAFGLALLAGGAWEFGSVARMSGRQNGRLIQSGIYRWTRNPQNIGWGVALVGVGLLGRSGASLLMAAFFLFVFRLYAPVEERYLARVFGEEWRRYERSTHRFFGWPEEAPRSARGRKQTAITALDLDSG